MHRKERSGWWRVKAETRPDDNRQNSLRSSQNDWKIRHFHYINEINVFSVQTINDIPPSYVKVTEWWDILLLALSTPPPHYIVGLLYLVRWIDLIFHTNVFILDLFICIWFSFQQKCSDGLFTFKENVLMLSLCVCVCTHLILLNMLQKWRVMVEGSAFSLYTVIVYYYFVFLKSRCLLIWSFTNLIH